MRNAKVLVAGLATVVILALAGALVWYIVTPHTAEAQFNYAAKLEKRVRADAPLKGLTAVAPALQRTIEAYLRVEQRFGKSPKAAEAYQRIAVLQREVGQDNEQAFQTLEHLVKDYPDEAFAGKALLDQAELLQLRAESIKLPKPDEALKEYRAALDKFEEFRRRYETKPGQSKSGDLALLQIGRIWHDSIVTPLINAIETFRKFLADYKTSPHRPEVLFRLASLLEQIHQPEQALQMYSELIEHFPKSAWADKALLNRGKILAEKMDKPKEAAEDFERIVREYPESGSRGQAAREGESARKQESEDYGKKRYGGRIPTDTLVDKAIPPSALLREMIAQKLDAAKYELVVTLEPAENRIRVDGTLRLTNRGEDKKDLLFMLGTPLEVKTCTVDGAEVKFERQRESFKVLLPGPLKKDAAVTLGFAYSGQYAAPLPTLEEVRDRTKPATAPASGPGSAPATRPVRPKAGPYYDPQIGLGQFGYALSGAAWYPATVIGDIFNAKVTYTVPGGTEVAANGAVLGGTRGRFGFETTRPVFGLYFVYGPYTVRQEKVGAVTYYTFLRETNAAKSAAYVKTAADILGFYADRFGPFPYEKLALAEVPLPPFLGGVGPASLMFLHEGMVAQPEVPSNLLAHELAHQWFGNLIPINMFGDGYSQWLSEGFATYADALYTEKTEGPEALARHMQRYGQFYFQFSVTFGRKMPSVRDCLPGSPLYRPVTYEKGAIVLHALRKVMGEEKFFALLRRWVTEYQDKPTVVADFRRMAGEVAGQDLSWFFAEWMDQTLFAHYVIKSVQMKETPLTATAPGGVTATSAGAKVTIVVAQPDDLINMPVDITFLDDGGRRFVADRRVDKMEQTVDVEVPFKPTRIILDEGNWILKHPGTDHVWPAAGKPAKPVETPATP